MRGLDVVVFESVADIFHLIDTRIGKRFAIFIKCEYLLFGCAAMQVFSLGHALEVTQQRFRCVGTSLCCLNAFKYVRIFSEIFATCMCHFVCPVN